MRADGAIPSVTEGVTTLNELRHGGRYAKEQTNWRSDPIEGLHMRPGTNFAGRLLENFDAENDVVTSVTIKQERYWVVIDADGGANGLPAVLVYDSEGNSKTVAQNSDSYFVGLDGREGLAQAVIGSACYLANRNTVVNKTFDVVDATRKSMVVVKQSPLIYSILKVSWLNPTTGLHTIEFDAQPPVGQPADEVQLYATNDVATELGTLIGIEDGSLTVEVAGSTVLLTHPSVGYLDVSVEDGAGNTVLVAINGEVTQLSDLPKYAATGAIVAVKPQTDTENTTLYVEAIPVLEGEIGAAPTAEYVLTAGSDTEAADIPRTSGFDAYEPFGSMDTTVIGSHNFDALKIETVNRATASPVSTLTLNFTPFTPGAPIIDYIHIVDTVTGEIVVSKHVDRALSSDYNIYTCTVPGGLEFVLGRAYNCYTEAVSGVPDVTLPEVRWEETTKDLEGYRFNKSTLPYVLRYIEDDDSFYIGKPQGAATDDYDEAEWQNRESGNNLNNPFPPFLNKKISDLGRFQDRLLITSGEHVCMSVSNQPTNFFRGTVSQLLATSPISIRSTGQQAAELEKIVDLGNDVVVFSATGQHRLPGDRAVTPNNAALPRVTSYSAQLKASPDTDGNDVYFAQSHGQYSKMQRYKTGRADVAKHEAFSISDHCLQLIEGDIGTIVASDSQKMLLVHALSDSKIYIYEYREDVDGNHQQGSWSNWDFGDGTWSVQHMRMNNDRVEIAATNAAGDLTYLTLNLYQTDIVLDDRLHLDNKFVEAGVTTLVTAPANHSMSSTPVIVQGAGSPVPWETVDYVDNGNGTYTLLEDMEGGAVIVGETMRADYVPPVPRVRDESRKIITGAKLRVTDYDVLLKSGYLNADIEGVDVDPWDTQVWTGNIMGAALTDDPNIVDGIFRVSFKNDPNKATLRLWTDSYIPTYIYQIEWRGTYNKRGRRI